MDYLILVPAYGRDYKTAAEVKAAWEGGKDFKIANAVGKYARDNGRYTGRGDVATGVPEGSYIRYNELTELTRIGVWEEAEVDELV